MTLVSDWVRYVQKRSRSPATLKDSDNESGESDEEDVVYVKTKRAKVDKVSALSQ